MSTRAVSFLVLLPAAALFTLLAWSASAHTSGHGPLVKGAGPRKGGLSAVVRAADAEKGREAAATELLVETTVSREHLLVVTVLKDRKTPAKEVADPEAKLILFFDGAAKPEVVTKELKGGRAELGLTGKPRLVSGEFIFSWQGEKRVADLTLVPLK
jgi:hypothetical protein